MVSTITLCSTSRQEDAALAALVAVLADPEFAERLKRLGYTMVDGGRLSRATEHGEAFIDLIAPAPASRALHSQPAGRFRVDQFPGVQLALNEPPIMVDIEAVPLEGSAPSPFRVAVPTVAAVIVPSRRSQREHDRRTRTTSTNFCSWPT